MSILRSSNENKTWIFILHLIERVNDFMTHIYTNRTHKYTFRLTYATMILQIFDLSTTSPTSPPPSSSTFVPAKSLQPQSDDGICPSSFCNWWHQIRNVLLFQFPMSFDCRYLLVLKWRKGLFLKIKCICVICTTLHTKKYILCNDKDLGIRRFLLSIYLNCGVFVL